MQKRLAGLLRDTWWLWLIFLVICLFMSVRVSKIFLVMIPILSVTFCYYAMIRYDDDGKHKEEGGF